MNGNVIAQINFGNYSSKYTVSATSTTSSIVLGDVIQGQGNINIPIESAGIVEIVGVKYLDVIVTIMADQGLVVQEACTPTAYIVCDIPYTLQAAYVNRGTNNINQAVNIDVSANTASVVIPIKYRGNAPPGPPPTPVYEGYNPAIFNETAYIYIYGSIDVGFARAGDYKATITVSVNYD
tara:strand:- start:26653 stop:27192 length:540 start_codon:yes stop_codon:yes gene_type:complete